MKLFVIIRFRKGGETVGGIIDVEQLVKQYGAVTAVDGVSFSVREGDLFAFLGPNGAGKTTTINIICTLLRKTSGRVTVDGLDVERQPEEVRRKIGVVFQNNVLDDLLTVRENLESRGELHGLSGKALRDRAGLVAERLGISDILSRRYGKLSGGQRRRVEVARALMSDPAILFLDEPTTGLDPQTRRKVWDIIRQLRSELHMTVFLTTHYMEEAGQADEVAIIDAGKIVAHGTPDALRERYSRDILRIMPQDREKVESALAGLGLTYNRQGCIEVSVRDSMHALSILKQVEADIAGFEMVRGDMDDVFIAITGRSIREEE